MAVGFSGALQLTDLDDFITPSQVSSHFVYEYIINFAIDLSKYDFILGMYKAGKSREKARACKCMINSSIYFFIQ